MADNLVMALFSSSGNFDSHGGVFLSTVIIFYADALTPIQRISAKPMILQHSLFGTGHAIVRGH
jgi:hypothetical protein